jgi:hypothetical protein
MNAIAASSQQLTAAVGRRFSASQARAASIPVWKPFWNEGLVIVVVRPGDIEERPVPQADQAQHRVAHGIAIIGDHAGNAGRAAVVQQ